MATNTREVLPMTRTKTGSSLALSWIAFVFSISGCTLALDGPQAQDQPWPNQEEESAYEALATSAEQVTLVWEPSASAVQSYNVLYRVHGGGEWKLAGQALAESPAVTLRREDFGNGSFDFAVTAVSAAGAESGMASSLDQSSQPGWYLSWTD